MYTNILFSFFIYKLHIFTNQELSIVVEELYSHGDDQGLNPKEGHCEEGFLVATMLDDKNILKTKKKLQIFSF